MTLKITNIENNMYTLINTEEQTFTFKFKFFGLSKNPEIGDYIEMNESLLDKTYIEYSNYYMFGPLNEPYGRKVKDENDVDVICLQIGTEIIYLKRFFG